MARVAQLAREEHLVGALAAVVAAAAARGELLAHRLGAAGDERAEALE